MKNNQYSIFACKIRKYQGDAYKGLGDYESAINSYLDVLNFSDLADNYKAIVKGNLAISYYYNGDMENAEYYCSEALMTGHLTTNQDLVLSNLKSDITSNIKPATSSHSEKKIDLDLTNSQTAPNNQVTPVISSQPSTQASSNQVTPVNSSQSSTQVSAMIKLTPVISSQSSTQASGKSAQSSYPFYNFSCCYRSIRDGILEQRKNFVEISQSEKKYLALKQIIKVEWYIKRI